MKKFLLSLVLGLFIVNVPVTTYAMSLPNQDEVGGGIEESGGGGGGEGEGGPVEPYIPSELAFSPNVTALHSVNGLLAANGNSVYFLPMLEDFPVDLTTTCADITTVDGVEHKFSVVYDGYFDNEVVYDLATPDNWDTTQTQRLQTSKRIYSQYDNSRALNILGYDLLLANEQSSVTVNGADYNIEYYPTLVGTAPLSTKTVMMDLYKAVGQYDWDIKIFYGKDDTLAVNTSPIMQYLAVDINDMIEGGIETDEGATYVWATRTNPDIYWERCKRDAIFDGGAHLYTKAMYVGNDVSVSFSKSEQSTVTMAEFCQLAHAVMELYGEPVMTEQERDTMIQMYALDLPQSGFSAEAIEDIEYLAAKGILDPSEVDFNKAVTFADIEPLLLRIADEQSRLNNKVVVNADNIMTRAGFVRAELGNSDVIYDSVEEITNPFDSDYYDYFIEAVDGKTNFYLKTIAGIDLTNQKNMEEGTGNNGNYVGEIPPDLTDREIPDYVFACDRLVVQGLSAGATSAGSGYFDNLGMVERNNRWYYHLRIARDIGSVTIKYDYNPETEVLKDIQEYTLPVAEGGIYNYSDGLPAYQSFDEAGFSDLFIDKDRCDNDYLELKTTESYLSTDWHWYVIRFDLNNYNSLAKGDTIFSDGTSTIVKEDIDSALSGSHVIDLPLKSKGGSTTPVRFFCRQNRFQIGQTSFDTVTIVCQTTMESNTFNSMLLQKGNAGVEDYDCYYKHDDGTLLVPVSYLRSKGLAGNVVKLTNGDGISVTTTGGNVVLRPDLGAIIIGDTYIPTSGETLYYLDGNQQYYINYKAVTGWTSNLLMISDGNTVVPCQSKAMVTRLVSNKSSSKIGVTYFPTGTFSIGYKRFENKSKSTKVEGIAMTGSNPLGCYMVVYNPNGTDKLFVWHRQGVKSPDGTVHNLGQDARNEFQSLTGQSVASVSSDYVLLAFDLSRNNVNNPAGFTYCSYDWNDAYNSGTTDVGYIYTPVETYKDVSSALNAYASGTSDCALPIVKIGNSLVNLNLNTCTDAVSGDQFPLGKLPLCLQDNNPTNLNKMGELTTVGKVVKVEETSDTYTDLNVELLAAPVGFFQKLKGMGSASATEITKNKGKLYFGSSLCTMINGEVTINQYSLEFDESTEAVRSLISRSVTGDVWVASDNDTTIGAFLEDLALQGELIVTEPERMIDWTAYKFERLVENLDSWSSIALIFVLNILPRVAILLFFALMLLSLITNVKPWRMFCERVFDIYSFLSFGKLNVNTVDTKRVVLISLICLAIFYVIMDGQLFNFILWVCEWFIVLYQR